MASVIFTCLSTVFLISLVYLLVEFTKAFVKFKRRKDMLSLFPSRRDTHWLWGNLNKYGGPNEKGLAFNRENVEEFTRGCVIWIGPFISTVQLWHPDTLKLILKTSEPKARLFYRFVDPWIGDGLLLSCGTKWARNRRLLTPAFHFETLKPYIEIKNRATDILLERIAINAKKQGYFDICPLAALLTLDIILQCACSFKSDCQVIGKEHPYVEAIDKLADLTVLRSLNPFLFWDFLYSITKNGREFKHLCDYVHGVSTDIINKRRTMLDNEQKEGKETKRYLDFLDILLTARDEDGVGLTDSEIRDETDTFLFEGHDTTASALYWTLFSIAEHPDHQSRVQEELDGILKNRQSDDIQWEDLQKMTFLSMCLKEAIRLHCPVPFVQRELTKPLEIQGVPLPLGAVVEISIYGVHHNPRVWDQPMEFRPERFAPANTEKRDPFAFIPFSAGSRNCIGQNFAMNELKIILARVLYRFSLVLDPNHKTEKRSGLVMRTQSGIMIRARPRQPSYQ